MLAKDERGQTMVELAIVMPVVLIVLIGVVQFALVYHAKNVAATAAQEGARLAAAEDRTAAEGAERAREVLRSGLGKKGAEFGVTAEDGEETVVVRAEGDYPLIIPWVTGNTIPIVASSEVRKEGFRSGP
ncbi:MAG TPA: TadE/TadG family type IV pilus assembly protein [Dehalococcoidia bacterium]|nr:TadE/TadG family type IV pilus assembly protein [Dehalococcoidia bacterium]